MCLAPCAGGHGLQGRFRWASPTNWPALWDVRGTPGVLSANGETRHHSVYITVVDQNHGVIRMCSRKEGDTHFCSSRASELCRMQQTTLRIDMKGAECVNVRSWRGAGTRKGHEYKLRQYCCSSRRNGHDARDLTGGKSSSSSVCMCRISKVGYPLGLDECRK